MIIFPGTMRARAGAFNPLLLSNLIAAYDVSDISTLWQDDARTSPVTTSGQTIGAVDDLSGNGRHAVQATLANRPVYTVSGAEEYAVFDATNDRLDTATFGPIAQPSTHILAVRPGSNATFRVIFSAPSPSALQRAQATSATGVMNASAGSAIASAIVITNAGGTQDSVPMVVFDGASGKMSNDLGAATTHNMGTNASQQIRIGASDTATFPLGGRYYASLHFSRLLTSLEAENCIRWLAAKQGRTL